MVRITHLHSEYPAYFKHGSQIDIAHGSRIFRIAMKDGDLFFPNAAGQQDLKGGLYIVKLTHPGRQDDRFAIPGYLLQVGIVGNLPRRYLPKP